MGQKLFKKQSELDEINNKTEKKVGVVVDNSDDVVLNLEAYGLMKNLDGTFSVTRIKYDVNGNVGALEKLETDTSYLMIRDKFKINVANSTILDYNY